MNNRYGSARQNNGPAANEIGSAWIKQSQDGSEYISIQFNENVFNFDLANCFIDMYVNEHKRSPKAPDYRIKAKPKQQRQRQGPPQRQQGRGYPQQRQQVPRPQMPRPRNFAPQNSQYEHGDLTGMGPGDESPMPEDQFAPSNDDDGGGNY